MRMLAVMPEISKARSQLLRGAESTSPLAMEYHTWVAYPGPVVTTSALGCAVAAAINAIDRRVKNHFILFLFRLDLNKCKVNGSPDSVQDGRGAAGNFGAKYPETGMYFRGLSRHPSP